MVIIEEPKEALPLSQSNNHLKLEKLPASYSSRIINSSLQVHNNFDSLEDNLNLGPAPNSRMEQNLAPSLGLFEEKEAESMEENKLNGFNSSIRYVVKNSKGEYSFGIN
jgi:hypothetical protein